jgi:alcohol dehydrogenase
MLGAAHAAANPLTAHFGIAHGHAVGLMLPHVVRFNAVEAEVRSLYTQLSAAAGISSPGVSPADAVELLARRLEALLGFAMLPTRLTKCGVEQGSLPVLATEAAKQWTAGFNPRLIVAEDFVRLYEAAFA